MGASQSDQIKERSLIQIIDENGLWKNGIYNKIGTYHQLNVSGRKWNKRNIKFMIELNPSGQIKYIYDGEILRIDNQRDTNKKLKILTNLEQIRNLKWEGNYGITNLEIGKWNMIWRGEKQFVGGLYNDNGQKEGKWIEILESYWKICQVFFVGMYIKGKQQGKWIYLQDEKILGGGIYNENGLKEGLWIELHKNFDIYCQITIKGEYKNNKKQGNWFYQFNDSSNNKFQKILGGNYNKDGLKNGKWIDFEETFDDELKLLYHGEYCNGKKQGNWNIVKLNYRYSHQIICCGCYDQNNLENGFWYELNRSQRNFSHHVKCFGQYFHGMKIGTWKTLIGNKIASMGEYNQDGKKNGQWIHFSNNTQFEKIDVFENFIEKDQIVYFGEYKNGQKQGDWKIKEGKKIIKGNSIIGGGVYDNQGLKDGSWIELWKFKLSNYIILKGFYKKGIKYGKWDIFLNKNKGLERIGGGSYDFEGMKHGKWINLHDNYNYNCQVFETGLYNHGIKQGKWDYKTINFYEHDVLTYPFWPKDSFYKIAGGNYEKGIKQGKWIELDENYHYQHQILYEGLYRNNIKQGEWEILDHHNSNLQKKGGGIYDEEGFKNFQWIELDKNNKKKLKLVEYSNGKIISEEILQNKI